MIKPRVFVKTGCPWCEEAEDFLKKHSIAYDRIDVRQDAAAFAEMQELSGQTKSPTMDWDGEILADFGADELEIFLKKKGVI